jgi:hypothetical protein
MVAQTCRKGVNPPVGLRMGHAEVYGDFKQAQLGSGQRRVVDGELSGRLRTRASTSEEEPFDWSS